MSEAIRIILGVGAALAVTVVALLFVAVGVSRRQERVREREGRRDGYVRDGGDLDLLGEDVRSS